MDHGLSFIFNIAVAVSIALVGGLVAHRLRQPAIVGYLLAGVLIGPFTPGFVGDREQIASLAEVGVIFLMFALGIEFSLKELARVRGVAVGGTSIQVLLTILLGTGLGWLLGWPLTQAVYFGGIIAISSTMVILKLLLDRGEVTSPHGRVLLSMLIVQDLAVVLLIVLLPGLTGGGAGPVELLTTLAKAAAFIGATLLLGLRVVPRLMAAIERIGSSELFLLMAVALALGTATVSALLGLSLALGAFLGGLLLTETEFDHRVVAEVIPMRDLFATLFFVSIGMLIDPAFVLANLPAVVGLALAIMLIKVLATALALLPFRIGSKTLVFVSLGMLQIGEFSYLLAAAGLRLGALDDTLYNLVLTSSLITIVLTPSAFWLAPRLDLALARLPGLGRLFGAHLEVLGDENEFDEHAIVVGYGRVGRRVVAGLREAGLPVAVIEEDLHLVQAMRGAGIPAIYGDASYQVIMQAAHVDRARLIVVALPDSGATRAVVLNARRTNLAVPIMARVAREEEEGRIQQAGATAIVAPERAGALMLLEESARVLGLDEDRLAEVARRPGPGDGRAAAEPDTLARR